MIKITEEQRDVVLAEVGYTRKQLDSDLQQIKDWLKVQHHLPPCRLQETDTFLKNYLSGCKGSLEKTKRKLDAYYTIRSHSELFDNRDPLDPDYVKMAELLYFTAMPTMTEKKRMLFVYAGLTDADQEDFHFLSYLKTYISMIEMCAREMECLPRVYFLGDFKGVTIHHMMSVKPLELKNIVQYALKVVPTRVAKISFINVPTFIPSLLNTALLPFVPQKVKDRFLITANGIEEVIHDLDKTCLPDIYGGDFPVRESSEKWRKEEIKRRDWFLNELSQRCDESKRIVPQDPTNPYFGLPGSLKRLEVD